MIGYLPGLEKEAAKGRAGLPASDEDAVCLGIPVSKSKVDNCRGPQQAGPQKGKAPP